MNKLMKSSIMITVLALAMGGSAVFAEESAQNPAEGDYDAYMQLLEDMGIDEDELASYYGSSEEIVEEIMEYLGFPGTFFAEGSDYDTVIEAYMESKERGMKEGFTPVLVIPDDTLLDQFYCNEEDFSEDIQKALEEPLDSAEIQTYLYDEFMSYMSDWDRTDTLKDVTDDGYMEYLAASEIIPESLDFFSSLMSWTGEGTKDVLLLEVPTTNPWEVVGYIPFSGYNECPAPDVLMNVCKLWYEKYGAEPVVINSEGMELALPETLQPEKALEAGIEYIGTQNEWLDMTIWLTPELEDQYQKTPTSELIYLTAECLQNSPVWYFWWD